MLIKSDIASDKKYIISEHMIEVIDNIVTTFLLNFRILVHFSLEAKEAINLTDVVSIPSFAISTNSLRIVIARIYFPNPSASKRCAINQVSKAPTANPPNLKRKETPPPFINSETSLSCNNVAIIFLIGLFYQKPRI